jgi:hypothetical protein
VPVGLLAEAVVGGDPIRIRAVEEPLQWLSLAIARRLGQVAGDMGEVGLDFGLDSGGRIWFIEQNAQPGRAVFEHLRRSDLSALAHLRPVQYARFLAAGKQPGAVSTQST